MNPPAAPDAAVKEPVAPAEETPVVVHRAWEKYESIRTSLPPKLSTALPPATSLSTTLNSFGNQSVGKYALVRQQTERGWAEFTNKVKSNQLVGKGEAKRKELADRLLSCAWSVTNGTQITLQISLNQVGPLYYAAHPPSSTFSRRLPPLYYSLHVIPLTTPASTLTPMSVALPIVALVGPVVVLTSLLLIPFVAAGVGGAAMASVIGMGEAVTGGLGAMFTGGKVVMGLVSKLRLLPGGQKVQGKLVAYAKEGLEKGGEGVVRYFMTGVAGLSAAEALKAKERREIEEQKQREKNKKKTDEVDVTGLDIEQVLSCSTGKKRVDKALIKAFAKLQFKSTKYKASQNPVLRVMGGPELEERRGGKTYLVFYPLILEEVPDIIAEPLPLSEQPPLPEEEAILKAKIVDTYEEAESIAGSTSGANTKADDVVTDSETASEDGKVKGKGKDKGKGPEIVRDQKDKPATKKKGGWFF